MKYIPGNIHESFIKQHHFLIKENFTFIIIHKRNKDLSTTEDYDNYTESIDLKKGDILTLRYYKYSTVSYVYTEAYVYLETINKKEYFTESIISRKFIEANNFIFEDITKAQIRNLKLKKIL